MRWQVLLIGTLVIGAPAAYAQQQTRQADPEACRLPGLDEDVLCGRLEVYEDRAAGSGRKIALRVVVLPATGPDPAPDPLFILAGGPGQAASQLLGLAARTHAAVRDRRDIVLVDQRGTGLSNPLACSLPADDLQAFLDDMFPDEVIRECSRRLADRADLTLYTTPIAMDDLDDVRAWLGYERLNLYGTSYGTRAALVYMRRHPERVRAAVLQGVAPTYFQMPSSYAGDAQRALDGLFEDCAEDEACRRAYPELREEFEAVLIRLDRGPVRASVEDPVSGETVTLALSREAFATTLRYLLYSPETARRVPLLVHEAFRGDFAPFLSRAVAILQALASQVHMGMFLSVTCAEDIPFFDVETAKRASIGTFLGDSRLGQQLQACEAWPRAELPPGYGEPVRSAAPVLIISGELDPVTPPAWGESASRHLANSVHVVVPGGGHSNPFPCVSRLVGEFLEAGTTQELDVTCVADVQPPPFAVPAENG